MMTTTTTTMFRAICRTRRGWCEGIVSSNATKALPATSHVSPPRLQAAPTTRSFVTGTSVNQSSSRSSSYGEVLGSSRDGSRFLQRPDRLARPGDRCASTVMATRSFTSSTPAAPSSSALQLRDDLLTSAGLPCFGLKGEEVEVMSEPNEFRRGLMVSLRAFPAAVA